MSELPTARLALPLLQPGQAQKEMLHNEALVRLDVAVQGSALAAGANVPPEEPLPGACWIIGGSPVGAWSGHASEVAAMTSGGWRFVAPFEGMRLWVAAEQGFALFSGDEWVVGRSYGRLMVEGQQVVGPRAASIAEPVGGTAVDVEARAAITGLLNTLRVHGLIDPG
ncbi:MAG: DUF2793 domain-containing protein [Sphingomonas sp.]